MKIIFSLCLPAHSAHFLLIYWISCISLEYITELCWKSQQNLTVLGETSSSGPQGDLCFLLCCYTLVPHRDTSALLFIVDHDIFYWLDVWYCLPNSRFNLSEVVFVWSECCFWISLLSFMIAFFPDNNTCCIEGMDMIFTGSSLCIPLLVTPYLLSLSFHYTKSQWNHWAG